MSGQNRTAPAVPLRGATAPHLRRALACVLALFSSASAAVPEERPLTLAAALVLARANNPALRAVRQRVAEARGELTGAKVLLPENPEIEVGVGPRLLDPGVNGNRVALEAGLSQRLEVGGQRGHRLERAGSEVSAAEAEADAAERALDLAVLTGFAQALGARERAAIAAEHESLARELLEIHRARFERGAATPLDLNGSRIRLAEATRRRVRLATEDRVAAARFAVLLGIDPVHPPRLAGPLPDLPPTANVSPALAANRAEVIAASARTRSARASVELAESSAWPDLRIGVRYAKEEASQAVLGQLAVGIPVFQRRQGERERARAAVDRAEAEERGTRTQAIAEFEAARVEAERARAALSLYDADVLGALAENLGLLRRMVEAGKVAPAEVIVLQRELLEGRLGYVDAQLDAVIGEARFRAASGLPVVAGLGGRS